MDRAVYHAGLVGVLIAGMLSGVVRADRIFLKDGSVHDGLIVEQTPTHMVIDAEHEGVVKPRRIPRAEVARVVWGVEPAPTGRAVSTEEELANRLRIAELTGTGQAYYDFGLWCAEKKLHTEAAKALEIAAETDPKLTEPALYRAAQSLLAEDHVEQAKRILIDLVRKNPRNLRAALQLGRLEAGSASRVARQVSLALERFQLGEYSRSISTLAKLANLKDPDHVADATRQVRTRTGMSIPELIAECRFRNPCQTCSKKLRTGLVSCPTCKGRGHLSARSGSRDNNLGKLCTTCRGFTYIICPKCGGAGHDFGGIGLVEREAMVARLGAEIDQDWAREVVPRLDPDQELPSSASEGILLKCRRLQYFLDTLEAQAERLDPDRVEEIRLRIETLEALTEQVKDVYNARPLDATAETDRIELEKLLLEDDAILREIAGDAADAETTQPKDDAPHRREEPLTEPRSTGTQPVPDRR